MHKRMSMQMGRKTGEHEELTEIQDLERRIMERFVSKPRKHPPRPAWSRTSILIIRKEVVPFYYAIYDHEQERFVELQYRAGTQSPVRSILVPSTVQPEAPKTHKAS